MSGGSDSGDNDGSGGMLLAVLTLHGHRQVRLEQGAPELQDVWIDNTVGSFYVGQITGAKHQVAHMPCAKSDLREARGRSLSIAVVFRTTLFNDRASRRRNGTPSELHTFAETV